MKPQLHLGTLGKKDCHGKQGTLWHSSDGGKTYWSGQWYARTPKQLKEEAESVLRDLRKSNPRLFKANDKGQAIRTGSATPTTLKPQ